MAEATLYYNPNCSKCRGALELLEGRELDLTVIEYLEASLDRATIVSFIEASDSEPSDFIRTSDKGFVESGIRLPDSASAEEVADIIVLVPSAMQRPVFVIAGKAVIARPPERALELL